MIHFSSYNVATVTYRNGLHDNITMKREDTLHYPPNSSMWLEVRGEVAHPFDVTGHYYPVLAGYIAPQTTRAQRKRCMSRWLYSQLHLLSVYYAYVEDSATAVDYVDDGGNPKVASSFYVVVLRHDPLDIMIEPSYTGEPQNSADGPGILDAG